MRLCRLLALGRLSEGERTQDGCGNSLGPKCEACKVHGVNADAHKLQLGLVEVVWRWRLLALLLLLLRPVVLLLMLMLRLVPFGRLA